jgi:hypothetical protein
MRLSLHSADGLSRHRQRESLPLAASHWIKVLIGSHDFVRYPAVSGASTGLDIFELVIAMTRNMSVVLYVVALIAVVVSVDLMFFKDRFWERLMVNIGIVLVFGAFYFRFLKNP